MSRATRGARLLEERARLLDLAHDAVFVRDMDGHEPVCRISAVMSANGSGNLVCRSSCATRPTASWAVERDESGTPVAFLVTTNDITERKQAEDALRKSEEKWRAVFEHNPTMYFMVDPAGTVASVNPFGAEQLGYAVEELVGRPVLNVFLEADRQAARSALRPAPPRASRRR